MKDKAEPLRMDDKLALLAEVQREITEKEEELQRLKAKREQIVAQLTPE